MSRSVKVYLKVLRSVDMFEGVKECQDVFVC